MVVQRILARCYINEARRVVDEDPQGAEGLFDLAEKTLLAYDDCTLALDDGDEERRRRAGEMDFQDDENDMQVSSSWRRGPVWCDVAARCVPT